MSFFSNVSAVTNKKSGEILSAVLLFVFSFLIGSQRLVTFGSSRCRLDMASAHFELIMFEVF